MLHPTLRNKIELPEHRVLYDLGFRLTSYAIRQEIQAQVRNIRQQFNHANLIDPFEQKRKQFGDATGNWGKAKIKELEKIIFDDSKPISESFRGQWRSIEFELIFRNENAMNEFTRAVRAKGLSSVVTIKKDGSLRPDEDDRGALCKEVCFSYKAGDEELVRYVCNQLSSKTNGIDRAYVNNTCGLHVHFDMRGVDEKQVKQYGQRLARCVPALKRILPKPRRDSQFCAKAINDINGREMGKNHIDHERYAFINMKAYRRFQTIEVRGHSGTLNATKILNWIALCEKIMTTRIRFKSETHEIENPMDLIKAYKLDTKLANYVQERFVKFNNAREREAFKMPAPREAQPAPAPNAAPGTPWANQVIPAAVNAQPAPAPTPVPPASPEDEWAVYDDDPNY